MPSPAALSPLDTLRAHLAEDLHTVEAHLARVLANRRTELTDDVGDYLQRTAGKRIRPILTLLAARGLGGTATQAAPVAAAMECVHVASLLHDDVIDQAPLRHGAETVSSRYGADVAILMGNYLYSHAFQLLLDTTDPRPLMILTRATARMCEGEMFQIQIGQRTIAQDDYLRIITDKTAHLIAACTTLGAVVAEADEAAVAALTGFGLDLGIAYQITDDALDYAGADGAWGKASGIDLREGKWTLPLIRTYELANQTDRDALLQIWNNGRELPAILEIMGRYPSLEQCFALARQHAAAAVTHLAGLPRNSDIDFLRALPDFVISRTH
ncbi:MAG: polyprenyl synthetase family protein [Candidatus Sumerlaeia bacterium]|nr:polyprenyl synthetase family protein [Candidatus Sumerlaeia bacterium]